MHVASPPHIATWRITRVFPKMEPDNATVSYCVGPSIFQQCAVYEMGGVSSHWLLCVLLARLAIGYCASFLHCLAIGYCASFLHCLAIGYCVLLASWHLLLCALLALPSHWLLCVLLELSSHWLLCVLSCVDSDYDFTFPSRGMRQGLTSCSRCACRSPSLF